MEFDLDHADWPQHDLRQSVEGRSQCDLLRCLFPGPTHQVVPHASWLDRARERLGGMAATFYDSAPCADLWGLWRNLEALGCRDETIRRHCFESHFGPHLMNQRGLGKPAHVKGCWVLDTVLCKS